MPIPAVCAKYVHSITPEDVLQTESPESSGGHTCHGSGCAVLSRRIVRIFCMPSQPHCSILVICICDSFVMIIAIMYD